MGLRIRASIKIEIELKYFMLFYINRIQLRIRASKQILRELDYEFAFQ